MLGVLLVYAISRIVFKHTKESGLKLRRIWITYFAYPILNIHTMVKGAPPTTGVLYIANHRSFADPIVISKFLNAFIIAKAEVASYPVINKGIEVTGIIYVKREDKNSRTSARKAFVDVIKKGQNVLVYPEGTVSRTQKTLPFKKGTFYEAIKEDIAVVPIALEYRDERDLWTIDNFVGQYLHQFGKWKTETKLTFGPILTADNGEELTKKCQDWINTEITSMQHEWVDFEYEK